MNKNAINIGVMSRSLGDKMSSEEAVILDETGFTRKRFFTSYFIDGRVFLRMFTFYIVLDDLFLNWFSTRATSAVAGYTRL